MSWYSMQKQDRRSFNSYPMDVYENQSESEQQRERWISSFDRVDHVWSSEGGKRIGPTSNKRFAWVGRCITVPHDSRTSLHGGTNSNNFPTHTVLYSPRFQHQWSRGRTGLIRTLASSLQPGTRNCREREISRILETQLLSIADLLSLNIKTHNNSPTLQGLRFCLRYESFYLLPPQQGNGPQGWSGSGCEREFITTKYDTVAVARSLTNSSLLGVTCN